MSIDANSKEIKSGRPERVIDTDQPAHMRHPESDKQEGEFAELGEQPQKRQT